MDADDLTIYGVSIHALLVECDIKGRKKRISLLKFQSTHSLWSATYCMETVESESGVSIHALLVECDKSYSIL